MKIFTINDKKEAKFLRQKTADFDFSKYSKKETAELIKQMREIMETADGVGLSANQVGLDMRVFVVQIRATSRRSAESVASENRKFYAIFNPEVVKFSKEKIVMEEGCLSVPETFGLVERPEKITLVGQDKNGRKIKIKAWGLLARVLQHEVDHLNGILFINRTKEVYKLPTSEKQTL